MSCTLDVVHMCACVCVCMRVCVCARACVWVRGCGMHGDVKEIT
eukprot:COSAG05_NODE_5313_length_1209_cov_0.818018_1_plen_44_part_10